VKAMKIPMGADFSFEEDGVYFRVYHLRHRVKVYAKLGKKTVIEYGSSPYEAAEKAKKRIVKAVID
jgi:hypothetical protein